MGTVREVDHVAWLQMRKIIYPGLTDSFHQQEMKIYVDEANKTCFVTREKEIGGPIGFIEVSLRNVVDGCLTNPVGYIEGIYVVPEHRGKGLGRSLMRYAVSWFREKGCSEMATDALATDQQAQNFHRKMGFAETYRVVQYKKEISV